MAERLASIYGMGIHSSLGKGLAECVTALQQPPPEPELVTCYADDSAPPIPFKLLTGLSEPDQRDGIFDLIMPVINEALAQAQLSLNDQADMSLYFGSSSFNIGETEQEYQDELGQSKEDAVALRNPGFGHLAFDLRQALALEGLDFSFNTACTASANALLTAAHHISLGVTRYALVVGSELFNCITGMGFRGLDLLASDGMRPFDPKRDGLVLGEAISAVVIGPPEAGRFTVCGGAAASDGHSISASDPEGEAVLSVAQQALRVAGVEAGDISCIKAHGTASLSNDESEAAGIKKLFPTLPIVCALKPHLGHTLGACGLTELILVCESIAQDALVSTPGISDGNSDLGISLNQTSTKLEGNYFMLNYFGFGGNNLSLVMSRE